MTGLVELLDNPARHGVEFRSLPLTDLEFEIKAKRKGTEGRMQVHGYASTFGNEDTYRDIVVKGAFKRSINERFKEKDMIRFLWQHQPRLGSFGLPIEMGEDSKGLWTVAEIIETRDAMENWIPQIRNRGVQGLSIGFVPTDDEIVYEDDHDFWGTRYIKDVELIEYSAVTFPANEETWIEGIKSRQLGRARTVAEAGGRPELAAELDVPPHALGLDAVNELAERFVEAYRGIAGQDPPEPARAPRRPEDLRSRRREPMVDDDAGHSHTTTTGEPEGSSDEAGLTREGLEELRNFLLEKERRDDALAELRAEIRSW